MFVSSIHFYLENDGTPLFLSADATGLKDGAVKLDGRYYFFDSYGVCQSGMIKFTSGGKTETAYFDPVASAEKTGEFHHFPDRTIGIRLSS